MTKINYVDLATMRYRGSFSYIDDNRRVVRINNNTKLKIESLGQGVARIYFVDRRDRSIQIPNGFTLWETDRNVNVPPRIIYGYGSFFINWMNSYKLFQNGVEVLALRNQMQQSLEGVDWFEYDVEMSP
ncbi:hypothetical protein F8M41_012338 [Gigaspora margarita]|uniref:Uncharacterized protein n=1 Tax=Gigaspora margarita TaxID=4874 RepID=A0A8H3WZ22_GIGMA|nr:hypothetical protein F8M41_012338 [Gigaspora margarita]